jgi:hypothetical protein
VNDLRSFAALQARVYEFLAGQDEATLRAIAAGEVRLGVLDAAGDTRAAAPRATPRPTPPDDPEQVVRDLHGLAAEQDRRSYLDTPKFTVPKLKAVARALA